MEDADAHKKETLKQIINSYLQLFEGYKNIFDSIRKIKSIEREMNIKIIVPDKDPYESLVDILRSGKLKEAIRKNPELAIKTIDLINELIDFFEKSAELDIIKAEPEDLTILINKIEKIKDAFKDFIEVVKEDWRI